jgi:hypothetical protein
MSFIEREVSALCACALIMFSFLESYIRKCGWKFLEVFRNVSFLFVFSYFISDISTELVKPHNLERAVDVSIFVFNIFIILVLSISSILI